MLKSIQNALGRLGSFFLERRSKKFNKKIINYEKICTFGVNPDSLINDTTNS